MDHPKTTDMYPAEIVREQAGQWVEANCYGVLGLHQMDRHEETAKSCYMAGELAFLSGAIENSALYPNHLWLSSLFEPHLVGGVPIGIDG